jgi:hypothetical protein
MVGNSLVVRRKLVDGGVHEAWLGDHFFSQGGDLELQALDDPGLCVDHVAQFLEHSLLLGVAKLQLGDALFHGEFHLRPGQCLVSSAAGYHGPAPEPR